MELAIIGSDDFVTGFQLVGLRHTYAVKKEDFDSKITELISNSDIGVLVVEEKDMKNLSRVTEKKLSQIVTPVVVSLSSEGKESNLRDMIKKSIGVDLWK